MKHRIGLPREAVLICVTPAGPVGEGTPSASGYRRAPREGRWHRFFGNRPASVPAVALVPHQKLCVAFPSKPVSWRTESSNHTGSGDDILCVWPFTHNERTPCEHQLLANCNLFAEGWNRRMLLVLWAVCWGLSVCIEMLWKAVAKHSVGLCGRATTALT